jgi:Asp-tRNA(Asn)/Glu-tRNA(Gln) amidotransferase A subunit family amidase
MPTEHGTVLHAGRRPRRDAEIVRRLRAAGAVLLGKTVTTELAVYTPGKTRNPHDPSRTPGGSSSGSAAAVADQMVPLALGSQTNGSVIRPAAYCGVYGFKPSFGLLPRSGVLRQSPPLDHVGLFARSLDDLALLGDVLAGHDPGDPDSLLQAAPGLAATLAGRWPLTPELAFLRGPAWDEADAALRDGFTELVEALGGRAAAIPLPDGFDQAIALHRTIMESDLALSFAAEWQRGRDQLSERLRSMIASGLEHRASDYLRARAIAPRLRAALDPLFDRFDAILTPATTGAAPKTLEHTGSPICCTVWTYLGLPALSLPLLADEDGMPIGVQLVGRHGEDARLLRTARWLVAELGAAGAMREP